MCSHSALLLGDVCMYVCTVCISPGLGVRIFEYYFFFTCKNSVREA